MSKFDYDLFIIGAGSGGVRAAKLAASYGARVAMAESDRVGGTCVIRGCVPKKLFAYAGEYENIFRYAGAYGWTVENSSFDWNVLMKNKNAEIDRLNRLYIEGLEKEGIDICRSRAVLRDPFTVHLEAEGCNVTAEKILVAAGGVPWVDRSVPGYNLGVTSDDVFRLESLPGHVVIVGGGYIALEFACIFSGLGCDVCLVCRGNNLLRHFDSDISMHIYSELKRHNINIQTCTTITEIEALNERKRRVSLSGEGCIDTDMVLWATGREPATAGLGLENAGVSLDERGAVVVDGFSQTSTASIYAVGDVTDRVNLTPVAIREGAAFVETVFNNNPVRMDYTMIPKAVFSRPQVASAGYTEQEARTRFGDVHIYKSTFRPMKYAMTHSQERTMLKLVVDPGSDRVLGCHMIGTDAAEIIQCVAIALKAGCTKKQFDDTIALHPTVAEELVTMKTRI